MVKQASEMAPQVKALAAKSSIPKAHKVERERPELSRLSSDLHTCTVTHSAISDGDREIGRYIER